MPKVTRTGALESLPDVEVAELLNRLGMTSQEFASAYGFSRSIVDQWRRKSALRQSLPVRCYLTAIRANPEETARELQTVFRDAIGVVPSDANNFDLDDLLDGV